MSARPGLPPSLDSKGNVMWLDRYRPQPKRRLTRAGRLLIAGFVVVVAFVALSALILSGAWQ